MTVGKKSSFIFLDVDGTIYTPRLGVPDSTREALDRLKQNGHFPVICTGRTKSMIFPELHALKLPGLIAGVGTYGEWQSEVLFEESMPEEETQRLFSLLQRFGFLPVPEGTRYLYYDPGQEGILPYMKRIFSIADASVLKPFEGTETDICKVSALMDEHSDVQSVKELLHGDYHCVIHSDLLLETFSVHTSKGVGMQRLLKHLHAEDCPTYAFGDSFNDLEMLEQADFGVCMGNGDPKLLRRIPRHAKPIDQDGIYWAIKEFGLI